MKIKSVIIQNFLTIGRAEIGLEDRGLLLIQGKNTDDSSADSNGAGKSSIADAICWALYGVTARGVSSDAVVNKTAKKDCSVELILTDGTTDWKIKRYRKDSTHKNVTHVFQRTGAGVELHKGTERETQEVINAIIGCSLEVFQAAVYAGQEKMPDLPAMTDKQLKLMIEEAAGTEVLMQAYQIARARLNEVATERVAIKRQIDAADTAFMRINSELIGLNGRHSDFEAQRRPQARLELAKTLPLQKRKSELTSQAVLKESEYDRDAQLSRIAAAFASLKDEQAEQKRLDDEAASLAIKSARSRTIAETAKKAYQSATDALRTVHDQIGTPCKSCGKPHTEEDLTALKTVRSQLREDAEKLLRDAVEDFKVAATAAKDAQERATAHQATLTDVSAMAARQKQIQQEQLEIEKLKKEAAAIQVQIDTHVSAAKLLLEKDNPYTAAKALLERQGVEKSDELAKLKAQYEELEKSAALLESAVAVYGPAGVRAHILDTVTPYLNARTSHYLSALADGNIHAVWNTLTKNGKGELKEKFCIEVTNDKGAESFDGLSGGEKRKVRLACAMALQDMVASRATKPIDIFIADEVDHALDESGLERLMTVLNDKAKERGTVLVISHNSLSDWIDEVITVTKKGGYAEVEGAIGV